MIRVPKDTSDEEEEIEIQAAAPLLRGMDLHETDPFEDPPPQCIRDELCLWYDELEEASYRLSDCSALWCRKW